MKLITKLIPVVIAASLTFVSAVQAQTVVRVATIMPDSHPVGVVLKKVALKLNARKDLNLKTEIYANGTLGGDLEALDQVMRGALQIQALGGISMLQGYDPKFGIEELPFLFADRQSAYNAMDGKLGDAITKLAEKQGLTIIAYWENGFRHFTNSKRPIITPSDMSGLRFRSAESRIRLEMFRQLKASAIPMPFPELYQALQQGVVDGQENPVALITTASLFSVQKHLSFSGHIWGAIPIVVSKKWFDGLTEAQRTAIRQEFFNARIEQRALTQNSEAEQVKFLKSKGMQVTQVDTKAFRAATEGVWKFAESDFGPELMTIAREVRDGTGK